MIVLAGSGDIAAGMPPSAIADNLERASVPQLAGVVGAMRELVSHPA